MIIRSRIRLLAVLVVCAVFIAATAQAGPFADFFKALRRSFGPPPPHRTHHTASHKSHSSDTSDKSQDAVNSPPNSSNTRTARVATSSNAANKADLKYGTPVPGKPGFVTSPFAPDGAYIDVRGFQPGTQVKDPYTGKTFLTP